ncbi:MAG: YifB family Mg chelatase-like AAA ATPase [Solirubrobacterales bacterium]
MLATVMTFALAGVTARPVTVEVDVRKGLPALAIVGLPDQSVRESRERVRAAIANSGFDFPLKRVTVSLAPANLRKAGPGFDLAIASAILVASEQLPVHVLEGCAVAGELALDGSLRPAVGALPMAEEAVRLGLRRFAIAATSGPEAALAVLWCDDAGGRAASLRITPLERLEQLALIGSDDEPDAPEPTSAIAENGSRPLPDLAELRGQPLLRRSLEISAAGGHGLLMIGPPGAGKSLAARRLPSLLPPLSPHEALQVRRIASACGPDHDGSAEVTMRRPFRAPHHTISAAGLVGGGSPPQAGEATLAHRGVLFLDELGEFARGALEALRQPIEEGSVAIVRARHRIELPCRFLLVAAASPCPCGRGEDSPRCACAPAAVRRYSAKLSGALADRLDIVLGLGQPDPEALASVAGESSEAVSERVAEARLRQRSRLGDERTNAEMGPDETRAAAQMTATARSLLLEGHRRLELSGRGHDRVLRVARTIADLADRERVEDAHVAEALSLRRREAE